MWLCDQGSPRHVPVHERHRRRCGRPDRYNKSVAEYKSSVGPDAYHLVVFDAASGSALASVYDKNTELIEQYVAHPSQRDGAAIFFALMPFLMSDAEFDEELEKGYSDMQAGRTKNEKKAFADIRNDYGI